MGTSSIETEFLIRKTGIKLPLSELRERFYKQEGGLGETMSELERSWLRTEILAQGGTPTGDYVSSLWTQLCAVMGFRVSKFERENRETYFLNAP